MSFKRSFFLTAIIFLIFSLFLAVAPLIFCRGKIVYADEQPKLKLPIIMYHNIIADNEKANVYEIKVSDFESDLKWLAQNGYTTVNSKMLIDFTNGIELPQKCVMLTFDDGFYNYVKYLLPLLEKYDMKGIVSVVGDFTKYNKNTTAVKRYMYLDFDDINGIKDNPHIEIANHTYSLHYNNDRLGVRRKKNENTESYKSMLTADNRKLVDKLSPLGINMVCYTYPYGAYCAESEEVIKNCGYQLSLTCEERVNTISRDKKCLYRLGRFNRSGVGQNVEQILAKVK